MKLCWKNSSRKKSLFLSATCVFVLSNKGCVDVLNHTGVFYWIALGFLNVTLFVDPCFSQNTIPPQFVVNKSNMTEAEPAELDMKQFVQLSSKCVREIFFGS